MKEKIALACDHRGYGFKESLKVRLSQLGYEPVDCGTFSEASCDYPDYMICAAEKVQKGECVKAIGICHSGIGSAIVANKVKGVRAALCKNVEEARLSRQHNDANMLILGAGFLAPELLNPMVETWLETAFEGGRHECRVNKIRDYEQKH
ncbi:MAG: RpiB/LacA/LacB family sugar-phosphate isomerase [Candidatus Omnitrophica bacterium]|nr:RpiB/LacA/LacB family sugar-phosphate isomerase [Candidatus Omnitrophota bacterium]